MGHKHGDDKLIIWDLDDTLWQGTLADGDAVVPYGDRIALIRALNDHGVVSSICSKNDPDTARAALVDLGWWDDFVFPRIAFVPRPQAIATIIDDMQLRAANILFVDDNVSNLEEVKFLLPDIQTLDITRPDADAVLADLLISQPASKSRVAAYRDLETRKRDRTALATLSNEDFLRASDIKASAAYMMQNLDHLDRIVELINRSNQLNYTKSRVTVDDLRVDIIDIQATIPVSIFVWDRYGNHGLVGFAMIRRDEDGVTRLIHFVFSCRAMHMGLEQYAIDRIRKWAWIYQRPIDELDLSPLSGRFSTVAPDWIETIPYDARAILPYLNTDVAIPDRPADIRLMCNCQSGGIAHYSSLRDQIVFDNVPNFFKLSSLGNGSYWNEEFPPYCVYHAGIDYCWVPWGASMAYNLDDGIYALYAEEFCRLIVNCGIQLLVILPPEKLPDAGYGSAPGATRDRTIRFNAFWRRAFEIYPGISFLDIDDLHGPEEMRDVNHHHPASLQKIAAMVDDWHGQVSAMIEAQAADIRLVA